MSDLRLRELKRRASAEPTDDNLLDVLRERLRLGELTQDQVELAAYCQHELAKKLAPAPAPRPISEVGRKEHRRQVDRYRRWKGRKIPDQRWVLGLSRFGQVVIVRAAIAVAETWMELETLDRARDPRVVNMGYPPLMDGIPEARTVVEAARVWLSDPSERNKRACWVTGANRMTLRDPGIGVALAVTRHDDGGNGHWLQLELANAVRLGYGTNLLMFRVDRALATWALS